MSILAAFLGQMFVWIFSIAAKKLAMGVAVAAAFVAVMAASYAIAKGAVMATAAVVGAYVPPSLLGPLSSFMPSNVTACLTAILLADTIITNWDYWRLQIPTIFGLAQGPGSMI